MKKVKITVPMVHFDGPLCGFVFVDSVCEAEIATPFDEVRLTRLTTLYNKGTTVEELDKKLKPKPKAKAKQLKPKPEPKPEPAPKTEKDVATVGMDVDEVLAGADPKIEEVEEDALAGTDIDKAIKKGMAKGAAKRSKKGKKR